MIWSLSDCADDASAGIGACGRSRSGIHRPDRQDSGPTGEAKPDVAATGVMRSRTDAPPRSAWFTCALLLPALVLSWGSLAAEGCNEPACLVSGDTVRPPFDALRDAMGADADYIGSEASMHLYDCPDLAGSEGWDVRSDALQWIHHRPFLWRELWTSSQSPCVVLDEVGYQRALSHAEALILLTASRHTFARSDSAPPAPDFCEQIVPDDCDMSSLDPRQIVWKHGSPTQRIMRPCWLTQHDEPACPPVGGAQLEKLIEVQLLESGSSARRPLYNGQLIGLLDPLPFAVEWLPRAGEVRLQDVFWVSSRGHVLGLGDSIPVDEKLRAGAQEVYALVGSGFDAKDPEEADLLTLIRASGAFWHHTIYVHGPWGALQFPNERRCILNSEADVCMVRVAWSTVDAGDAAVVEVDSGEHIAVGPDGSSVFSFRPSGDRVKLDLQSGAGRRLDRKSIPVVRTKEVAPEESSAY
jgi:hypothetical protein